MMILILMMTLMMINFPQALECLEVPSIENGTAGQFQVLIIIIIMMMMMMTIRIMIEMLSNNTLFAALGSDEA